MERVSQYASEMNKIQDTVLEAISVCRDEIEILFEENADDDSQVDYTLKGLFAYQSDRSQTISFLASANYWWDAEIIMRSFYETHAKIWLICQSRPDDRQALVEEFWGAFAELNASKKAKRAKQGGELFRENSRPQDAAVYETLGNEDLYDFHQGNRKERKALEQKWSFSEILKTVRHQGFWERLLLRLSERLAHLLVDFRRLDCGIANAAA